MARSQVSADHGDSRVVATGGPETTLSEIRPGVQWPGMTIAQVIRTYGPPKRMEDAVVPDGAGGTRFYIWEWQEHKMSVATYFVFRRRGLRRGAIAESRVAYVDVWGDSPIGKIGVTGRGMALGDTLQRQAALYGDRYWISYVDKDGTTFVEARGADGSFLMLDYGADLRCKHLRLAAPDKK